MASKETQLNIDHVSLSEVFSTTPLARVRHETERSRSSTFVKTGTELGNLGESQVTLATRRAVSTSRVGTDPIVFDDIESVNAYAGGRTIVYSDGYLKIKLIQFVAKVQSNLDEWLSKMGDPSELRHVKDLFKLVEQNTRFFDFKPETRIMLGSFQNFLLKWDVHTEKQILHFKELLNWFAEGEVDEKKLKAFTQQVFIVVHKNAKKKE